MEASGKHKGTIIGIVAIVAIVVASCAFFLPRYGNSGGDYVVVVHDGDGAEHTLSLDEDRSVTVETTLGSNTIVVEDGTARMSDADCPNHDCMRQHPISQPGQQLICLPHKLWVEIVAPDGGGADALDEDAVVWSDGDGPTPGADVDTVAR